MRQRSTTRLRLLFGAIVVALAWLACPSRCLAEPIRIVVAAGHRSGLAGEAPLKHAGRDATRVRDVFVQLGGVRPEHAFLLSEPAPAALWATLDRAVSVARTHPSGEVTFVFYFSGHGDREHLHFGGDRVALRDLEAKIATIPASLKILVADACRTASTRAKGVSAIEPFAVTLDGTLGGASGFVRIHASADGEVAQESDDLGGAVFTHYWVSGLAGAADADADARVTLAESYAFAYGQTLYRSARASGVVQRPAAEFDMKEAAPVVLTQTAATSAVLLPRAANAQYVVYGLATRTVMGELSSSTEHTVALAVPPGSYIVHRRGAGGSGAAQVSIGRGERRELRGADFRSVPEETLARKGFDLVLRPHEFSLGYLAGPTRLSRMQHELSLRYGFAFDRSWALSVAASGALGSGGSEQQESRVAALGIDALLEKRMQVFNFVLRAGVGPTVKGTLQTLRRTDAERLARAGYGSEQQFRGTSAGARALVGARIPFDESKWVEANAQGEFLGGNLAGNVVALWGASVGASVGLSF